MRSTVHAGQYNLWFSGVSGVEKVEITYPQKHHFTSCVYRKRERDSTVVQLDNTYLVFCEGFK